MYICLSRLGQQMLANDGPSVWKISEAKARLSEIMRLAENGEAQMIGTRKTCVLVSLELWERAQGLKDPKKVHLGRWLLKNAPRGTNLEVPPREVCSRPIPFIDYAVDAGGDED